MRKLLSIGALLAASTLNFWQPQRAMANARVGVDVVVVRPHRHHDRYYYYRYHHYHRYYYRY
jgi:hypothetical protein